MSILPFTPDAFQDDRLNFSPVIVTLQIIRLDQERYGKLYHSSRLAHHQKLRRLTLICLNTVAKLTVSYVYPIVSLQIIQLRLLLKTATHILGAMDIRIAGSVRLIARISRRKAIRVGTRMIRAAVAAGIARRRPNICTHNAAHVSRQTAIGIVVVDADLPRGGVSSHILVHERQHSLPRGFVRAPDVGRAKQAAFLA